MSQSSLTNWAEPNDGYQACYTEKLWSWLPENYRTLDEQSPSPGALRALVEIVAQEATTLRRDIDRLWDDQAIELCDDWAVSYLGALVGVTPLSDVNSGGNRLAAGRAIAYQRRKGTPTVIQMALHDIAGVQGVVSESFRRLARFPHRLDIDSIQNGAVTSTPVGGFANLKQPRVTGLIDSGFDETAHFPDIRRQRGPLGLYGIRKVNLHLFPYRSIQIELPSPVAIGANQFTMDPSGRDVALYQRGQTSSAAGSLVRETDLPDAILCRRFNASKHRISAQALAQINDPGLDAALAPILDLTLNSAAAFRKVVAPRLTPAQITTFYGLLLDATMTADAAKAALWLESLALTNDAENTDTELSASSVLAANLENWQTAPTVEDHISIVFDPQNGRMIHGPAIEATQPVFVDKLHLGIFDFIGAVGVQAIPQTLPPADSTLDAGLTGPDGGFVSPGPVPTSLPDPLAGTHRFDTSRTYQPALPTGRNFDGVTQARLDAADGARPHIRFRPNAATLDITFTAAAQVEDELRTLEINGLWLGIIAAEITPEVLLDASDLASPISARIILDGHFDSVILRNVTIDPGGERARLDPLTAVAIPIVRIEIEGQVDSLLIDHCITGPIWETNNDPALCNAGKIDICDSIVQNSVAAENAIQSRLAHVSLTRCTVFGRVEVARLNSSNSIILGRVRVTDSQHGCFRYSATGGIGAVLPPQFESYVPAKRLSGALFRSQRFGDAEFAVLSETAPQEITHGAENEAEMGVFNSRALSVLLDDLARQVRDLLPVGQTPQFIIEQTSSQTEDTL